MDPFKNYLQQNLDELDSDVPDAAVWQRLRQATAEPAPVKKMVRMSGWRYAAAASVVLLIGLALLLRYNRQPDAALAVATPASTPPLATDTPGTTRLSTTPLPPDTTITITEPAPPQTAPATNYARKKPGRNNPAKPKTVPLPDPGQQLVRDVEQNYNRLVNFQLDRLRTTPVYAESPDYFSTFKIQFRQIEKDETTIKRDIRQHGLTDELLQQLININQQKLNVLKDLQAEINKLNNKVKQPASLQDSSRSFYLNM